MRSIGLPDGRLGSDELTSPGDVPRVIAVLTMFEEEYSGGDVTLSTRCCSATCPNRSGSHGDACSPASYSSIDELIELLEECPRGIDRDRMAVRCDTDQSCRIVEQLIDRDTRPGNGGGLGTGERDNGREHT